MAIGTNASPRSWHRRWGEAAPWAALPWALRSAARLEAFLGLPRTRLTRYVVELDLDAEFLGSLTLKRRRAMRIEPAVAGWVANSHAACLYALVRWRKPRIMVETGVGPGSSAAFVLRAMQRNHAGRLVSIDLPGYDLAYYPSIGRHADIHIPTGFSVGWQTHPSTRTRWDLRLGDARTVLPDVLEATRPIQMFFHDSLHTAEHMTFEYTEAAGSLEPGGLLLSDDVMAKWSLAFVDFCRARRIPFTVLDGRLGVAVVPRPATPVASA